ncbi:MAG: hypothetical protein E6X17_15130 [Sporomusaceae bacterium]|nr:hypothetical protein [Sporomusaceae bacterium]
MVVGRQVASNFTLTLLIIAGLGILMLLAAYAQQYCSNWFNLTEHTQVWLNSGLLNVGSSLIGSVFIIVLYERAQEIIREKERKRRQLIALNELGIILRTHNSFIMSLYAATGDKEPGRGYNSAEEAMLDKRYIQSIKYLDIYKPSSQSSLKNTPWYMWLHDSCLQFQQSLREIQNRYYGDLDTEIVSLISNIINDDFIMLSVALPETVNFNKKYLATIGFPVFHSVFNDEVASEHINLVASLIAQHNSLVNEEKKISYYDSYWKLEGFPIGFGRVDNNIFRAIF